MNKKITYIITGILLVSLLAIAIAQTTFSTEVTLPKEKLDALKGESKQGEIAPTMTDIVCGNNSCRSWIYQQNVIQTEWVGNKYYCSKINTTCAYFDYNTCLKQDKDKCTEYLCLNIDDGCLQYSEYSLEQLETARTNFVYERLSNYAGEIVEDKSKSDNNKGGAGTITFK